MSNSTCIQAKNSAVEAFAKNSKMDQKSLNQIELCKHPKDLHAYLVRQDHQQKQKQKVAWHL